MSGTEQLDQDIQDVHERFFAALASFDDDLLEMQPMCGVWSPRDVAGHLADWNNELMDALDRILAGQQPNRPIQDIDNFNQVQAALRGIQRWKDTSADLRESVERVHETLRRLDDGDLERLGPLPWGTVDRLGGFFRRIIRHSREHAEEAEDFRLRMLGVRD